jgi:hypothetical protein
VPALASEEDKAKHRHHVDRGKSRAAIRAGRRAENYRPFFGQPINAYVQKAAYNIAKNKNQYADIYLHKLAFNSINIYNTVRTRININITYMT